MCCIVFKEAPTYMVHRSECYSSCKGSDAWKRIVEIVPYRSVTYILNLYTSCMIDVKIA